MNDLIIRITGTVEASNLAEYRETALAEIRAANKKLVTDDDFAAAELVAKRCKEAEDAIVQAKADALAQTADINSLFTALDSLSEELRCTRLSLSKQIDTEKANRKAQIVKAGIDRYMASVNGHEPLVASLLPANISFINEAIKNKRTVESMEAAVAKVVDDWIADNERRATDIRLCEEIIFAVSPEYRGLFPDLRELCATSPGEVHATVEGRVAKFKLEQAEKEKREADAAKQTLFEKTFPEPVVVSTAPTVSASAPINMPMQEAVINDPEQWMIVMLVSGTKAEAVSIARRVDEQFGEDKHVLKINLRQQ